MLTPPSTCKVLLSSFAAAKLLSKTLQVDGGVNIGLNRATPDLQLYAGVAARL